LNFDKNHKKIKQKQEINKTVFSCLQFTIILKEENIWRRRLLVEDRGVKSNYFGEDLIDLDRFN